MHEHHFHETLVDTTSLDLPATTFSRWRLQAGEWLFREGDVGDCAYLIESGKVEIFSERTGQRQVIAVLGADAIFGEMALLGNALRAASACAGEPTVLLRITREYLDERLLAAEPLTRHLLRTVVSRCREAMDRLHGLTIEPLLESPAQLPKNDADHALALTRLRVEESLEHALAQSEFELYYQPIVDLRAAAKIAGFEALVRWNKPGRGLVPPSEFIPVAEETDLIHRLGRWILQAAADGLLALQAQVRDQTPLFVTVNLSARQLQDAQLLPELRQIAERLKGQRGRLKLELTESLMIGCVEPVQQWVQQCHELGFDVVLDDFGTGYSSLAYLHRFDADTMKLDRAFVVAMHGNAAAETVVRGVIRMAHELQMNIVAEGIEMPESAEQLRALGVEYAQGYYFGKPMTLAAARALL